MRVEHFMTKDPIACEADTPLEEVAQQMRDKNVGCVVVLRNGKAVGLCTDRQIVTEALADGLDPGTPVEDIMVEGPARVRPDDNIIHAIDTLRSAGVARRALVVNAYDELVGLVSISDIAVIAERLNKAVYLELTHASRKEAHLLTGAKRIIKHMRRPTKEERLAPDQETHVTSTATPMGLPTKRGMAPRTARSR